MSSSGDSETKKPTNYVKQIRVKVDAKQKLQDFLGELTRNNIIDPENSEADREPTVVWRDPFRMSVLDFQRSALDKVAEILKIWVKYATELGPPKGVSSKLTPEEFEDLQVLLHHIKAPENKEKYAQLLHPVDTKPNAAGPVESKPSAPGPVDTKPVDTEPSTTDPELEKRVEAIVLKCTELSTARNVKAHQKYVKKGITPHYKPSSSSKNKLGAGYKAIALADTRTFQHTEAVILSCLDFAVKVQGGMAEAGEPEIERELMARVANLEQLKNEFMKFIKYRELERHNLEAYHQETDKGEPQMSEEEQKEAALQVLELLKEKVKNGEDDVTSLLVCVVAPRCCIKLEPSSSQ